MPPLPSCPGPGLLREFLQKHNLTAVQFCDQHPDLERSRFSRILNDEAKWYDVTFACAVRDVTRKYDDEIPVDAWKSRTKDRRKTSRSLPVTVEPPPQSKRKRTLGTRTTPPPPPPARATPAKRTKAA